MLPRVVLPARLRRTLFDKRVWVLTACAILIATYPFTLGALGGWLVSSKLATKLGVEVGYAGFEHSLTP